MEACIARECTGGYLWPFGAREHGWDSLLPWPRFCVLIISPVLWAFPFPLFFSLLFFFLALLFFFLPFHHIIYFTSLLQIEANAFSISLLYFEDKKVCWKDGGGRESSGTFSGGEGVLLVSGWKGGWLLSLLLCFSKSSQNHFPL